MFQMPSLAFGQLQGLYDTLDISRQRMNDKKIDDAIYMLRQCEKTHRNNIDIKRLLGQALYWSKDFNSTITYFRQAIQENPNANILKMDLGRILFEMNDLSNSKYLIEEYFRKNPDDIEAPILLATIEYWNGKSTRKALRFLAPVFARYPANPRALSLRDEIHRVSAPWIKIKPEYYTDSQPFRVSVLSAESGWYGSSLFQPSIQIQHRNLDDGYVNHQAESFQFSNKSALLKLKSEVIVKGGLFNSQWTGNQYWMGSFELNKKLSKSLIFSGSIDHSPYLFTVNSLRTNVFQTNYGAALNLENFDGWSGKLVSNLLHFDDNNQVQSFSAWALAPIVKSSFIKLNLGYAYHTATSQTNRFVATKTIDEIVSGYYQGYTVAGFYDPYYTPQNLTIHSVLGNVSIQVAKSLSLECKSNVGLYAVSDNPYLFLNLDNRARLVLDKGYSQMNYHPWEVKGKINWIISNAVSLDAEYTYRKTLFFDSKLVTIGLMINF